MGFRIRRREPRFPRCRAVAHGGASRPEGSQAGAARRAAVRLGRGPAGPARGRSWRAGPPTRTRDPDAASLLLEDYLAKAPSGRRGQPGRITSGDSRSRGRALEGLLAQETACRSMGRRERRRGIPPPPARCGRRGLRLPPAPAPRARRVRPGVPGGAGRPGRPPRRSEGQAIEGDEPQTLAQLLHTNIVPIYSLHEDRRAGLRAVCMPYLGGASLSAVLAKLWADSPRPVSGEPTRARPGVGRGPAGPTFRRKTKTRRTGRRRQRPAATLLTPS